MGSRLCGSGTRAQDIALFAPRVEPGLVVTWAIAQPASDAVDFRNIGAAVRRTAQRAEHPRRPAVVSGEIDKVVGLRRCLGIHRSSSSVAGYPASLWHCRPDLGEMARPHSCQDRFVPEKKSWAVVVLRFSQHITGNQKTGESLIRV